MPIFPSNSNSAAMKFTVLLLFLPLSLMAQTDYHYGCDGNTFWTLDSQGNIQEWQLDNNTVTGGDTILENVAGPSLAYCGDADNQTFYVGLNGGIRHYEAPDWILDSVPDVYFSNAGGYKSFQYYMNGDFLHYYNGTDAIFLLQSNFEVADVAVDTLGQAWTLSWNPDNTAYLKVIDTTGAVLRTYVDSDADLQLNGYGMFFLDDTLRVGFGSNNQQFPKKIVSIIPDGETFYMYNPIDFSASSHFNVDMASCMGTRKPTTGTKELSVDAISFFPNPTSGMLHIQGLDITSITLYDLSGKKLADFPGTVNQIDLGELAGGMYYLQVFRERGPLQAALKVMVVEKIRVE